MKRAKIIIAIMILLISFGTFLSIYDAYSRVQLNIENDYHLSDHSFSFRIEKDLKKDTLQNLYELCKQEKITILLENQFSKQLGIFDTTNRYIEEDLFIGSYFSEKDFIERKATALILAEQNNENNYNTNIIIEKEDFNVIGEYLDNYILHNHCFVVIYSLFSLNNIQGKFYIDCNDEVKQAIISLFNEDGYEIDIEQASLSAGKVISYISQDAQFNMIMFIFVLAYISFLFTDYAIAKKEQQKNRLHYLVGSNYKQMLLHELLITSASYALGITGALIIFYCFMNAMSYKHLLSIHVLIFILLVMLIIFIGSHMIIYILLQKKYRRYNR